MKEQIKELLTARGMSQAELGRKAGIKANDISTILNTDRNLNVRTLERIATALGVTVRDLFPGEESLCGELEREIGRERLGELLEWVRKIKRPPGGG